MTGQREGWGHCWSACLTAEQCSTALAWVVRPAVSHLEMEAESLKVEFRASVEYTGLCLENEET